MLFSVACVLSLSKVRVSRSVLLQTHVLNSANQSLQLFSLSCWALDSVFRILTATLHYSLVVLLSTVWHSGLRIQSARVHITFFWSTLCVVLASIFERRYVVSLSFSQEGFSFSFQHIKVSCLAVVALGHWILCLES
jgi:hypothetical protein